MGAITAKDVEYSGWKLILHLNYGAGGYGYQYQSVKYPDCVIGISRLKRKEPETRKILVGDMEVPDFQAAAELLSAPQEKPNEQ